MKHGKQGAVKQAEESKARDKGRPRRALADDERFATAKSDPVRMRGKPTWHARGGSHASNYAAVQA